MSQYKGSSSPHTLPVKTGITVAQKKITFQLKVMSDLQNAAAAEFHMHLPFHLGMSFPTEQRHVHKIADTRNLSRARRHVFMT